MLAYSGRMRFTQSSRFTHFTDNAHSLTYSRFAYPKAFIYLKSKRVHSDTNTHTRTHSSTCGSESHDASQLSMVE